MKLFHRDSGGNLILASHHPKWSLTWSWALCWNRRGGGRFFYGYRTYRYRRGLYGRVCIGRLSLERQPTTPLENRA